MEGVRMVKRVDIESILANSKTIAVVGLSRDPSKDSYEIAEYLKRQGYRIIPVNPNAEEILGEPAYPSLADIPETLQATIDMVNIFRPSDEVPQVVEQAIRLRQRHGKPSVVWMQVGIIHQDAAKKAEALGFQVVMDRCLRTELQLRSYRRSIVH